MVDIQIITKPKVSLITSNASDNMVVASMLVSTLGEDSLSELDNTEASGRGRINFLMKNRHGTPFEHNMFTFYIRAGIFVFREFHRHRIGWSYNEESGRYKVLEPIFYIPATTRPLSQSGKPGEYKMSSNLGLLPKTQERLNAVYQLAYDTYIELIEYGVAKEVARMCLPVGLTSSMYATCNARSLMSFLSLRTSDERALVPSHPQYEIEQVALEMEKHFAIVMPLTYEAWINNGRVAP